MRTKLWRLFQDIRVLVVREGPMLRDVGRRLKNHRLATHDQQGPQRDGEGTFAGMRGNDGVAPMNEPARGRGARIAVSALLSG